MLFYVLVLFVFFFSSRRRHTRSLCDWSSDVCSSDLEGFDGFDLHPQLPLVIHRAPRVDVVVAFGGLKWWRDPLVQGIGRLRSEERRVGKECRSQWWQDYGKKREK